MANLSRGEIKIQANMQIPLEWKEKLEDIARKLSVKRGATVNYQDVIRETIDAKFKLSK